ncbi:MAG: hypothetical protein E7515_06140 [Ruminococcaceae bacterium]|jgi:hypothetical protein|nr:hypothetical protein [Oscillospiraceae bacterium]
MGTKTRPIEMTDIESILEKNIDVKYNERWHPTYVSVFENALSNGSLRGMNKELRKNIAYSLQYLQYIQLQFEEIHLHEIIATLLIKNYIITSMGIIEGLFYHLVKSNKYQLQDEWEIEKTIKSNTIKEEDKDRKYEINVYRKLSRPNDRQMTFDQLINTVQNKKLIKVYHSTYPYLRELKTIRNKVHLQIVNYDNDTDYMSIDYYDYLAMRSILHSVLINEKFKVSEKSIYDFIKLDDEEDKILKEQLKKRYEKRKANNT